MQIEALERWVTPIAAALIAGGSETAWSLLDDIRDGFDEKLLAPMTTSQPTTALDDFRQLLGGS